MNERGLLCVMVPAAPATKIAGRLRLELGGVLLNIGMPASKLATELVAMEWVAIEATTSRAVLDCLNDAAFQLEHSRAV